MENRPSGVWPGSCTSRVRKGIKLFAISVRRFCCRANKSGCRLNVEMDATMRFSRTSRTVLFFFSTIVGCYDGKLILAPSPVKETTAQVAIDACTTPGDPARGSLKFMLVVDESSSNQQRYDLENESPLPGTDRTGGRRYGALLRFLRDYPVDSRVSSVSFAWAATPRLFKASPTIALDSPILSAIAKTTSNHTTTATPTTTLPSRRFPNSLRTTSTRPRQLQTFAARATLSCG